MKLLNPLRRNICHLCCVDFFQFFLFCNSCNIEVFPTFIHPAFARILVVAVVEDVSRSVYWLIPANGGVSYSLPLFTSQVNGLVLLVIGGRSNAYCAFLTGLQYSVLPLNGRATSLTYAGHFLAFQVLLLELHIALEIYVVSFSNAKVVGSFRMARLNMFRRWSLKFLQPDIHRQPVVNFSEVLLFTE